MELLEEGKVKFYTYKGKISREMEVFFNPAKKLDRDLNVEIIKIIRPRNFLDLMAATGIRGLRIAKNFPNIEVILNDINKKAYDLMKKNAEINNLKVRIFNEDASKFLINSEEKFDYIDIDPFGSPIYWIEDAVRKLTNGGYLAITSTDLAPLVGSAKKKCLLRYSSVPLKSPFSREVGIRILIGAVQRIVAKYNKYAEPIFSFFGGYYYRVYFKIYRKNKVPDVGFLFYDRNSLERKFCRIDEFKNFDGDFSGPLYLGKLWRKELVNKIGGFKIVDLIKEEMDFPPFYFTTYEFSSRFKSSEVSFSKLKKKLVDFSRTHFDPKGFRTNEKLEKIKRIFIP